MVRSGAGARRTSIVSSWSCPFEVNGLCNKVAGAYCRPGMKGCILVGKVRFADGVVPEPRWPPGKGPSRRPPREDGESR